METPHQRHTGEHFVSDGFLVPGRRTDPSAQALLRKYIACRDAPAGTVLKSEDGLVIATKRDFPDDPFRKPWEVTLADGDFVRFSDHEGVAHLD